MSALYEFISMRHADEPRPRLSLGERNGADPHLLEVGKTAGGWRGRGGLARRVDVVIRSTQSLDLGKYCSEATW